MTTSSAGGRRSFGIAWRLRPSRISIRTAESANHAPFAAGSGAIASGAPRTANAGRYLNLKCPSSAR